MWVCYLGMGGSGCGRASGQGGRSVPITKANLHSVLLGNQGGGTLGEEVQGQPQSESQEPRLSLGGCAPLRSKDGCGLVFSVALEYLWSFLKS